ncbi:MAG: aspartate aminotransferase family protein [Deltaproteobacteria bacterium]|nr:aspartate aminotransferase family protein [Deltaproteobacteria bacterium]
MPTMKIPSKGASREEVLSAMTKIGGRDADWRGGRTWSLVYHADEETSAMLKDAYSMFFSENGLSPIAFPSLRRFENEVVAMTAHMLGGGESAAGTMTSGGSESILMAVKAARDWARERFPKVDRPEMLLPVTAHPAFFKAAHYFDVKPVLVPVDAGFRANVAAARAMLTGRTVLTVGSAPAYPHGVIDPIEDLAAIAKARGIWMHVDACLGGFMLPWVRRLGHPIPPFDLSVDGVCSISADIHKYGFSAKGASTIIYRDAGLRRHQFFAWADWPGGLYGSPSMTGTRPGGAIAAAWAALMHFGEEGYLEIARGVMDTTRRLLDGIGEIPGLRILGEPAMSVFAFDSDRANIYTIGEVMAGRGWHMDRQHMPASLHLMVTPAHAAIVEPFLADLRAAAAQAEGTGASETTGMAAIYGMVGALPDRGAAVPMILDFLDQTYALEE